MNHNILSSNIFNFLYLIFLSALLISCDANQVTSSQLQNATILSTENRFQSSTEIGNFVTTAVRRANNLDMVFLPSTFFSKNDIFEVKPNMNELEIERVLDYFPRGPQDQLLFGTMKGSRIKDFIVDRVRETYDTEMEVDGIQYSITINGGFITVTNFLIDGKYPIKDEENYRIAVSDDFYFGSAFPGYKYRNGFNFNFKRERYQQSIRDSIKKYLSMNIRYPYWKQKRAVVRKTFAEDLGFKKISEIQGTTHTSPIFGKTVTTRGIVTAFGAADWYPFGHDVYIQSITPDNDPRSSEGIHVFISSNNVLFDLGDEIEVTGVVFEDIRKNGMGETTLRDISNYKIVSDSKLPKEEKLKKLPVATLLGREGRKIPTARISTYGGTVMRKQSLKLSDGIDFWESLEGMRVAMNDLQILGFRGGNEDLIEVADKFYLNLYVIAKDEHTEGDLTFRNGLLTNPLIEDFNPEITVITTNHLSNNEGLVPKDKNAAHYIFNVGDEISGRIEGVMTYQKNVFGGGEYSIVLPQAQDAFSKRTHRREVTPVLERGITKLVSETENEITIATYNLENLSGHEVDRLDVIATSMAYNLKCPDVLNLVEIQDNNGISFRDDQDANETLKRLRGYLQSMCPHRNYQFVNVDPYLNAEGGQPGGNIRVSMFYNNYKLSYEARSDGSIGDQAIVQKDGILSSNPGRIYPNDSAFRNVRRSVIVEFDILNKPGEKLYLIGNHLNSKLGDIDFWGNTQPARTNSDFKRAEMTAKINEYIRWLEQQNSKANIVVLGDFNALPEEGSLSVLTNNEKDLKNMIYTLPKGNRYSINFNGNSQAIDFIFVNNRIYNGCAKLEIMHINSDFMGRLSDHDPVILKACF